MRQCTQTSDLRFQRTRKNLQLAFANLLKEKNIEQISVTELSKLAGVNRTTFYLHYRTPPDIMEDIYQNFIAEFSAVYVEGDAGAAADMAPTKESWENIYRFLAEKRETVRLLTGVGYHTVRHFFEDRLLTSVLKQWQWMKTDIPANYYLVSRISSWTAVLHLWIQNDMRESPEEIAEITMECRNKCAGRT